MSGPYDDNGRALIDPQLMVCAKCFGDDGLKHFVASRAESKKCSFCGATSKRKLIAAPLIDVVEHMATSLNEYYRSPDDAGMAYESAEGGYQGATYDTYDLLTDVIELELPNDDGRLFEDIRDGLGDQSWCTRYLYQLGPNEQLSYGWEKFCELIKHRRRFFFMNGLARRLNDELLSPAEVLAAIFDYAQKIGLVSELPVGRKYFRVRRQDTPVQYTKVSQLGPPPVDKAIQSNRMSPAGVVMTYVSEDRSTALRETADKPGTYAVGTFVTERPVRLFDIAALPAIPSLFEEIPDSLEHNPRQLLIFLHEIAQDISRPINRDGREHVEYVPTQVVTEYVRMRKTILGKHVDGIRYRSARDADGISLVLFADQDNIVPDEPKESAYKPDYWLRLKSATATKVSKAQIAAWAKEKTAVLRQPSFTDMV